MVGPADARRAPRLRRDRAGARGGRGARPPRLDRRRGSSPPRRHVRLLPAFDGILLGHRDRALTVRPEHARDVLPGGGILRPTVLADGLVEGTWRFNRGTPAIAPFDPPGPDVAAEIEDVVRFREG